jgi:hypothetical protein
MRLVFVIKCQATARYLCEGPNGLTFVKKLEQATPFGTEGDARALRAASTFVAEHVTEIVPVGWGKS